MELVSFSPDTYRQKSGVRAAWQAVTWSRSWICPSQTGGVFSCNPGLNRLIEVNSYIYRMRDRIYALNELRNTVSLDWISHLLQDEWRPTNHRWCVYQSLARPSCPCSGPMHNNGSRIAMTVSRMVISLVKFFSPGTPRKSHTASLKTRLSGKWFLERWSSTGQSQEWGSENHLPELSPDGKLRELVSDESEVFSNQYDLLQALYEKHHPIDRFFANPRPLWPKPM